MDIDNVKEQIRSLEMNPFFVPSEYDKIDQLPKLCAGKANFKEDKCLAEKLSAINS